MKKIQRLSPVTYEVAQTETMIRAAKQLCHDVYLQVGYIDSPYEDRMIPYEYDHAATYLVALNADREVVGTLRLTQAPFLNTLDVWKDRLYTSCVTVITAALNGNTYEIGALAVRKDWCVAKISWGLYKAAFHCARLLHMDYAIISMDARALRSMQMLGWKVVQIGEPMDYFGSLTVPGLMQVNEQPFAIQSKNQSYHQYLAA